MQPPDIGQLVAVLGPTAGILVGSVMFFAWLFLVPRKNSESLADKLEALSKEIAALREDQRREVTDLRRELSAVRETLAGMKAAVEYLKERK